MGGTCGEHKDICSLYNIVHRWLKHTDTVWHPTETLLLIFGNTLKGTESFLEDWSFKISGEAEVRITYLTHLWKGALTNC